MAANCANVFVRIELWKLVYQELQIRGLLTRRAKRRGSDWFVRAAERKFRAGSLDVMAEFERVTFKLLRKPYTYKPLSHVLFPVSKTEADRSARP